MAKKFSTLIKYINEKIRQVVDFFGTESSEYAKMKHSFESSFNGVPYKDGESVVMKNVEPSNVAFDNVGFYQVDPSAVSYEISASESNEKMYRIIFEDIYSSFKKDGTLFQMASKYQYRDVDGVVKHFVSMEQARQYQFEIQTITRYKFNELKGEYDNSFYISGNEALGREGDFEEEIDEKVKEKIIEKLKARKGTSGVRAEVLYEEAKNMYYEALMDKRKKQDLQESSKNDTQEEYTQENALNKIRVRRKR